MSSFFSAIASIGHNIVAQFWSPEEKPHSRIQEALAAQAELLQRAAENRRRIAELTSAMATNPAPEAATQIQKELAALCPLQPVQIDLTHRLYGFFPRDTPNITWEQISAKYGIDSSLHKIPVIAAIPNLRAPSDSATDNVATSAFPEPKPATDPSPYRLQRPTRIDLQQSWRARSRQNRLSDETNPHLNGFHIIRQPRAPGNQSMSFSSRRALAPKKPTPIVSGSPILPPPVQPTVEQFAIAMEEFNKMYDAVSNSDNSSIALSNKQEQKRIRKKISKHNNNKGRLAELVMICTRCYKITVECNCGTQVGQFVLIKCKHVVDRFPLEYRGFLKANQMMLRASIDKLQQYVAKHPGHPRAKLLPAIIAYAAHHEKCSHCQADQQNWSRI